MTQRRKQVRAYAFTCPLDLAGLRARLDDLGPWRWVERDSHWFADYISARCREDYGMLKVYETGEQRYQIDILFEAEGPDAEREWAAFHADLLDRLLPAIPTRNVHATETMS